MSASPSDPADRARAVRALLGWASEPGATTVVEPPPPPPPKRKRTRTLPWLPLVIVLALLAGCEERRGIVLWHAYNDAERDALVETAKAWNDAHPDQPLELVSVPYKAFADKLTSAIPGGNGPDLFIYPQDRIGDWADGAVIEPIEFWIDDARATRFSDEALAAMAYKGSLWGLPLAVESLVLYYRTDLVPHPPRTTDELVALTSQMKAARGYAVAYANGNLYGHAPWLFGYGGKVFDDAGTLSIATPEAARAMQFARELVASGAAPERAEGPQVATLFNSGKTATVISGPWFVSDIAAGVPWKIATLPVVSATGTYAQPFLGTEGILMSARARDKETAFAVMDALTSDAAAIVRAKVASQVVPNPRAYDDAAIATNETLAAFRAQLEHSVPMPNDPQMRLVWTPYETALGEVLAGRADPGAQLLATEREIAGYLDGVKR